MASGFGSNFQALIDAIASGSLPQSRITALITNRKTAYAMARADKAEKRRDGQGTSARQKYNTALAAKILSAPQRPELIVLAGWMYMFSPAFLNPIDRAGIRIINLHLAMSGEFYGANAIERAFAALQAGILTCTGVAARPLSYRQSHGGARI
ncbi:hypothetical protein MY10362_007334 [Beauveria mimosiformis]